MLSPPIALYGGFASAGHGGQSYIKALPILDSIFMIADDATLFDASFYDGRCLPRAGRTAG